MKIFEGKTPTERNKIIAAIVLGTLAVLMLTYTFGGMFFGGKKVTVTTTKSPTPKKSDSASNASNSEIPNQTEINALYASVPVVYNPFNLFAPDAGRNIFAFYEPPVPTPYSPTPTPIITEIPIKTPPPTPTPPLTLFTASASNGGVIYAGQSGFQIEVSGDKFTPDSRIIVNGSAIPTTFVNSQRLTANITADLIRNAGTLVIMVATPDGKLYSNPVSFSIQAAPQPLFRYIGVTIRKGNNNNTATIKENDKESLVRLKDIIAGRFEVVSISRNEIVVKDVVLGFRYPKLIESGGTQASTTTNNNPRNVQTNPNFNNNPVNPVNPTNPNCPPGIPCDKYPIVTPNPNNPTIQQQQDQRQKTTKDDYDDDGDN